MAKLADAADLKSAGPKGLWGFDSPSRHHSEEILRRKKRGSGFRLRAPVRKERGLTPAKRLNLKSAGPKGLWGFDSPSRHQITDLDLFRSYQRIARGCIGVRILTGTRRMPDVPIHPPSGE
jgi:hypothetical protein